MRRGRELLSTLSLKPSPARHPLPGTPLHPSHLPKAFRALGAAGVGRWGGLWGCCWAVWSRDVPLLPAVLTSGCDDLIGAVFELGRTLCRLQLSDEELALFTAAVLLSPGTGGSGGDAAAGTGQGPGRGGVLCQSWGELTCKSQR